MLTLPASIPFGYAIARDSIRLRYRSRFHSLRYRLRFHSLRYRSRFHSIPFHSIPFHFIGSVCIYTEDSPASFRLLLHYDYLETVYLLMSYRGYETFVPFLIISVYRIVCVFEQGHRKCVELCIQQDILLSDEITDRSGHSGHY